MNAITTHCDQGLPIDLKLEMAELNLNIFNILIISGVVHGIIFSVIVLSQKKYATNNVKYLSLIVLFLSLSNFQYWLLDTKLIDLYPIIKYIYIPWHWLVLPMFYFYVQKFIGKQPITKILSVYLIGPFVLVLFIHLVQVFYKLMVNKAYDIPSHFSRGIFVYVEFFSIAFNIILMVLTHKMIINHEKDISYDIKWIKSETNWLKKLIYLGMLTCLFWLCAISIVVIYDLNRSYVFYPMWIGISILVYWIGYVGLQKSKQLEERIGLRKKRIALIENLKKNSHNTQNKNTFLRKPNVIEVIEDMFNNEKLYLNPNLSLEYLANKVNLSTSHLSKVINNQKNMNFKDYVNGYRLEEAKKLLKDKNYDNYTIVAIGLECGFNSKSAFYSAFKKQYQQTPNQFRNV